MSLLHITRQFAKPNWIWYASGLIALIATTWITVTVPKLAKEVVNNLAQPSLNNSVIVQTSFFIMILGLGQIFVRTLSRILIFWPGRKLEYNVREFYFNRILKMPLTFFLNQPLGDLISRISNDVSQLRIFYAFGFLQAANFILLLFSVIVKMYLVHPLLTFFCLSPLVLMLICTRLGMPYMHTASLASQQLLGQLTNQMTEVFVNISTIQLSSCLETFEPKIQNLSEKLFKTQVRLTAIRNLIFPLSTLLSGCSHLVVLFYGGSLVMEGKLSVGDLMAFNLYIGLLGFPLTALGIILSVYHRAKVSAIRLEEIRSLPLEADQNKEVLSGTHHEEIYRFNHLSYTYPGTSIPSLRDISLSIKKGERIGIEGPIGSGKTTLLHLLAGLLTPAERGQMFFCKKDALDFTPSQIRQQTAYALQSPYLFSDTIVGNITFGMKQADQEPASLLEEARVACENAQMLEDVLSFDQKWQTPVGEQGVRLSGGQKQRIALSRIFIKDAPIWILDDTTSALDETTENKLIHVLAQQKQTMIIASHRPQTLKFCDRIIRMDAGRII